MKQFWICIVFLFFCSISSAATIKGILVDSTGTPIGTEANPLVTSSGTGGASALGDLSDVGTATATAGYLLVGDGSQFQGVALSGSCTLLANGVITCSGTGMDVSKTISYPAELDDNDKIFIWKNVGDSSVTIDEIFAGSDSPVDFTVIKVGGGDSSINWDDVEIMATAAVNDLSTSSGGINWYTDSITSVNWSTMDVNDSMFVNWTEGDVANQVGIQIKGH